MSVTSGCSMSGSSRYWYFPLRREDLQLQEGLGVVATGVQALLITANSCLSCTDTAEAAGLVAE